VILFDTDVCIEILRGNRQVLDRWESKEMYPAVSFMTVAELYYGAERSKYREENIAPCIRRRREQSRDRKEICIS
jgi:predicted nucleic acid-binding protein